MGSIYFNGSELTGVHDVNLNGVAMDNAYLNGVKLWTKHPYTPGTTLFSFEWGYDSNFSTMITTHWGTYGLTMFKQQPYTASGSPGSDYRINVNLQPGFNFSSYTQTEYGTDSDGQGTATGSGQSTVLYSGGSVTGATGFSVASSGNGSSTIVVGYSGE